MKRSRQDQTDAFLDLFDLSRRGWSAAMVRSLLGDPDTWLSVDHFASFSGKKAYHKQRVESVESGEAFRAAFIKSARRRKLAESDVKSTLERSLALEESGVEWPLLRRSERASSAKTALTPPFPISKPKGIHVCTILDYGLLDERDVELNFFREGSVDRICEDDTVLLEREATGTVEDAVRDMMPTIVRQLAYSSWKSAFVGALVSEQVMRELWESEVDLRKKVWQTNLLDSNEEIVLVAKELNLNPQPSWHCANMWQGNCPGTNHFLLLNTQRNEFCCGYCKRSGGIDGLRSWVEQRRRGRLTK